MSEKEKMLLGEIYDANYDEELMNERIKAKDLLAQVLSHEIDHLNGIVFVKKVELGTLETVTPEARNEKK